MRGVLDCLMFRRICISIWVVSFFSLALAPPLRAQRSEETGPRASFTAGASFGDGETALALSAALGFPLSDRLGLEFELAYARKLDFTIDLCPAPRVCVLGGQLPVTGRTVSLVPHLLIDLLPVSRRHRAYIQAGVGAGHVRQRYFLGFASPVELTRSNLTVAFSVGGGASVQISRRLSVGADVRSLHLIDDEATADRFITPSGALDTLRVGSQVSWRF